MFGTFLLCLVMTTNTHASIPWMDLPLKRLNGSEDNMNQYKGKVIMVVNTASQCGLTGQYKGLEKLYQSHKDSGLVILGFPSNQFGGQEPGSSTQIAQFCEQNYGVSFPMFQKTDVNGPKTHPLYTHLKAAAPGLLGSQNIKWNFTKFLISRDGKQIQRFSPQTKPKAMEKEILALLEN